MATIWARMRKTTVLTKVGPLRAFTLFTLFALVTLFILPAPSGLAFAATLSKTNAAEIAPQQIAAWTALLPDRPQGLGPVCADRSAWGAANVAQRTTELRRAAEKLLSQPFPAWDTDVYLEYSRNGQRPNGERMMNARKAWLYPLVVAECVEGKGRFLPAIERTFNALLEQPTWTWPAHDRTLRNLRDHHYEVDLLAADTAHELAQALYLLGDWLNPDLRRRTQSALEERIFAPLRHSFAGLDKDHFWLYAEHNWNAVCLKGTVGAALAVLPDKADRALFAAAGAHYIQRYLTGFTADGYTAEGPGYWNYGFSHFAVLRELLWQASGGQQDLFADSKVRNIALYGYRFEMLPGNIAAFGDASARTRMDDFTRAYANDALNLAQVQHLNTLGIGSSQSANDAPLVRAVFMLFGAPQGVSRGAKDGNSSADVNAGIGVQSYFDSVGVLVSRPGPHSQLGVSIKAGGNGNHSHNDVGSYTIALGSEQPVGDVGAPQYSAKTFSKERYLIPAISSWGHPVPVVAGQLQLEADKLSPKVTATHFSDEADDITINLADAYSVSGLRTLTRQLVHSRAGAGTISIIDRFAFSRPNAFEVALTTLGSWKQNPDGSLDLWQKDAHLTARIEASGPWTLKVENSNEEGLRFTRIAVVLSEPSQAGFVRVVFTPAQP